jgi:hypothetical protein
MNTAALADTSDTSVFIEQKGAGWKTIKSAPRDGAVIDVWLTISASPMSMGMSDSFGVPDAWFQDGKWVHTYRGKPTELDRHYVTHWRSRTAGQ